MQSKGAIKFVAILLAIACIWQLSFTLVTSIQENKAEKYAQTAVEKFTQTEEFAAVPEGDRAYVLDSLSKKLNRTYIDSISNEKVYFRYTYKDVKSKEINLGLDLKGGMNVMLQVQLEDIVSALAGENKTPEFHKAYDLALERSRNSASDFITLFADAWKEVSGGQRLAQVFGTIDLASRITPQTSDDEVIAVIRENAESAIANSFNVLRNRIDRFGVTQPSIQKIGNTGRILVELPGVKDPERVKNLLQGTASLEFWTTFTSEEVMADLSALDAALAQANADEVEETEAAADSTSILESEISGAANDAKALEAYKKQHPLFALLQPSQARGSACIGYAQGADTAAINRMLSSNIAKGILSPYLRPKWTVKPSQYIAGGNVFELVAIKAELNDGKAPLDGAAVTDARVSYDGTGMNKGNPSVSMSMNADGANKWARLTRDNIGKQIAIVLDGLVYSYPNVQNEISGGHSSITGNFDVEEATDLANVLNSGKLPAPAKIVQEQVVGPSLGSESIRAGLISFIIAFILVLVYMIFFYSGAGVVADIALLCNVLFLFGTLVSFGAVLTLPGIAGLVLTLGMAVDANVIIYERIKEELAAGKGLSKAIADGYSNAYSAIIDGQLTTMLTGFVLFVFGSGPVQGFATTLIIGIITSVITSIFITRLILENRVSKGKSISFENNLTKNFLKNTHFDFIGKKKITYIFSGVLILISLVSIFTKGFTYGVDFTGGRTYVVRFDQPVSAEEVRASAEEVFAGSVEVKQFGGDSQMKITTKYGIEDESAEMAATVSTMLYDAVKGFFAKDISYAEFTETQQNPNGIVSSDMVGPTIANDIKRDAVIAVLIALFVIFAYIAFRFRGWTWGLGGVVSLAHTAIIVIGFFSLFSGILPFNLDVDQTFIAAILTIIGYAINDNVVIFDRIREYKNLHPKADFRENTNLALNSTLTRTMNTSISTLVTMLAIAIFGGESVRGLSVALILGICFGTYASLFIGTPVMFDATAWNNKRKAAKKK